MITEVMSKSQTEDIINRLVKRYGYAMRKMKDSTELVHDARVLFIAQQTNNSLFIVKYLPEAKVFSVRR